MSLLGVVAGFMTHECDTMLHDLQRANDHLKRLAKKDGAIREVQEDFERRLTAFQGYVSYSRLFVRKAGSDEVDSFAVSGQVRYVIKHFSSFAEERGITITNEVPRDIKSPLVPVTAYSGILVNLLTNALKAIIAVKSSIKEPRSSFAGGTSKTSIISKCLTMVSAYHRSYANEFGIRCIRLPRILKIHLDPVWAWD